MHPTGVASAAWVFAAAPSKAPLYVAGSLLACWAVLLAATGITHPGFPGSAGRARLVMLASALLVATTLTAAVVTGGPSEQTKAQAGAPPGSAGTGASNTLQLAANPTGQLAYDKKSATVKAGSLSIRFVNKSPVPHNVTIALGTRSVAGTSTIQGATSGATATLQPGRYVFYCSVDAHRQAGMEGTLTVR